MKEKIRNHIDILFENAPKTKKADELKEQLYASSAAKYDNLTSDGIEPEEAYINVINSLGDVSKQFAGLEDNAPNYADTSSDLQEFKKTENAADQGFRDYKSNESKKKSLQKSLSVTLWTAVVFLYLAVSFMTGRWDLAWPIFPIAGCVQAVLSIAFKPKKMTVFISILIVLCIVFGVTSLVISTGDNGGSFVTMSTTEMKLVNTQNISLKNISDIEVSYISEDIYILESETDEVVVKEYMGFEPKENQLAQISTAGNKLTIKNGNRTSANLSFGLFHIGSGWGYTEIYLPEGYHDAFKVSSVSGDIISTLDLSFTDFSASSVSGEIELESVSAKNFKASTTSGDIDFTSVKSTGDFKINTVSGEITADAVSAPKIEVLSVSGDINIDSVTGKIDAKSTSGEVKLIGGKDSVSASSVSGDITIENASGTFDAYTTSGELKLLNCAGGGKVKTTSGDIHFECTELMSDLFLSSTSGEINLTVPEKSAFTFNADTLSGDIETYFDDIATYNKKETSASADVGGKSDKAIKINTASGSIMIESN